MSPKKVTKKQEKYAAPTPFFSPKKMPPRFDAEIIEIFWAIILKIRDNNSTFASLFQTHVAELVDALL